MRRVHLFPADRADPSSGRGFFTTLVLAEGDDDMWLATVAFDEPPQPGSTFHFRGEVWEIVWREKFGCRAEPAVM